MKQLDILNKSYTDNIKGLAIIFIVVGHLLQMLPINIPCYKEIMFCIYRINIIFVGAFFFFSAFGNYLSISKIVNLKDKILKCFSKITRIYQTFIIALIIYTICYFLFHNFGSFVNYKNFFYYIITLTIPGLTMWYIKTQVVAYIVFLLTLFIPKYKSFSCFIGIIFLITLALFFKISPLFWQTLLCFPLGYFIAENKDAIFNFKYRYLNIVILFIFMLCCFCFFYTAVFSTICLAILSVLLIMHFSKNKLINLNFLKFLGKYTLELYIYHWVYIAVIRYMNIPLLYKYLFVIISLILTIGILIFIDIKKKVKYAK